MAEIRIIPKVKSMPKLVRVAAYARVSNDKDAMLHSLSSQVSYFSKMIQAHAGWKYVGVYSDEGMTGTKVDRAGFIRLIEDAKAGKIDIIVTKSLSRFARNTVDCLRVIREMKAIDVDIYFEEQGIHTLSTNGEFMISILAGYAQEESRQCSENILWRVRKNFSEGKPWGRAPYGYVIKNGKFVIVPKEAEAVRLIFRLYLDGIGSYKIKDILNERKYPSRYNCQWDESTIRGMLKNYIYTGNAIFQTTYIKNYITKAKCKNRGERPLYHVEESHEAIISLEDFNRVQKLIKERQAGVSGSREENPFKGKLVCAHCGHKYLLKKIHEKYMWRCNSYVKWGTKGCNKQVPDEELQALTKEILGISELSGALINEKIEMISVEDNRVLTFYLTNGTRRSLQWKQKSRSESWTKEMKEEARRKEKERNGKSNNNSINN